MSKRTRTDAASRLLSRLLSVMALVALLLVATACQDLGGTTESTTTTVEAATLPVTVFGTWDGTYTPTAIWDADGPVDDPPITLDTALSMHMELYPWSEETEDYGTVDIGGFYPSTVTSLEIDGNEVLLSVLTRMDGADDHVSTFTLTLESETLTGEDSGDPDVPEGWMSTAGSILLTRTAFWEDSGSTVDTEGGETAPDDAASGASADDRTEDSEEAGEPLEVPFMGPMYILTTTTQVESGPDNVWMFDRSDSGQHKTVRLHDLINVTLTFPPADQITYITWLVSGLPLVSRIGFEGTKQPGTNYYVQCVYGFNVIATGETRLRIVPYYSSGGVAEEWWIQLEVTH